MLFNVGLNGRRRALRARYISAKTALVSLRRFLGSRVPPVAQLRRTARLSAEPRRLGRASCVLRINARQLLRLLEDQGTHS